MSIKSDNKTEEKKGQVLTVCLSVCLIRHSTQAGVTLGKKEFKNEIEALLLITGESWIF